MAEQTNREPDNRSAIKLLDTFKSFGGLVKKQNDEAESFDERKAYGSSQNDENIQEKVVTYYNDAFGQMDVGVHEEVKDWLFSFRFKGKGIIDAESLYSNLRLLPDRDIRKIRLFNRFVGQEYFRVTTDDIIYNQKTVNRKNANPYFERLQKSAVEFADLFEIPKEEQLEKIDWPKKNLDRDLRDELVPKIDHWRKWFRDLPGLQSAVLFFSHEGGHSEDYLTLFNEFFHLQRQFDSDDWKDFDEENNPYPQPLARIASYRKSILDMNAEFQDSEGNISMCYDYCRMKKNAIVQYIRVAEDSFMKIVNRLDDDYPIEIDFGHRVLHERAKGLKHMLFPMRCLFFDELEEQRGMKESNDNTLDSYFDMSLGNTFVSIPEHYQHKFTFDDLEPELAKDLESMMTLKDPTFMEFKEPEEDKFSTSLVVNYIQGSPLEQNKSYSTLFGKISEVYEEKFKVDENNISRRLARLFWMYTTALSKKDNMQAACQQRLDSIQNMSKSYMTRAVGLQNVNLDNEDTYLKLEDNQLPLLASPEQLEDLYHTSRVVSRLADSNSEFEEQAKHIEEGLKSAMDMLKQSEAFIEKLVAKIFPDEVDRIDLLDASRKLISLSYKAQMSLANASKKALMMKKKKSKRLEQEIAKEAAEVKRLKEEVGETKEKLKHILEEKRNVVQSMRITETEKANYQKRLRMITVMTVNSMQAQNSIQDGVKAQV